MTVSTQIRLLRQQKGYSQENMADMLGLSTTAYGDIERGKTDLTLSRLQQIATALGTTTTQLLSGELVSEPELYPAEVVHQVETLKAEQERKDREIENLQREVAYWKRKAEEMALVEVVRNLTTPTERNRIGF
ncbi:transcriptional regulator with XRE-family HTH domain [Larkinella arboricola]|uniref:Transcriptional regulator with XRE-family HTH domain n=1 Tax=Larkinella arboricola TaxID=643671 RepID=A0A327WVZ5_LARAB|nr:helix-turn-helix domain-containing protein [Larkinella arboricola]RAJ95615.1 transcriptional regulator with XRE-family HTH domain [Larkinella arboricola]